MSPGVAYSTPCYRPLYDVNNRLYTDGGQLVANICHNIHVELSLTMKCSVILIGVLTTIVFAIIGGVAFHFIESPYEQQAAQQAHDDINQLLSNRSCIDLASVKQLTDILQNARTGGLRLGVDPSSPIENLTNWDIKSTIFLAFQIIGSVGYGNAPPVTTSGRVFCVFYGLIGIPVFVVAVIGIAEILNKLAERLRVRLYDMFKVKPSLRKDISAQVVCAIILLLIGIILFVIIPAGIFTSLETWTYWEALYCCFITVLTIGFNDFVPSQRSPVSYRTWYSLAVGFWIMIALFWFGGVLAAIRGALNYSVEIYKPLHITNEHDEQKIRVDKNWKKRFDKQWKRFKSSSHVTTSDKSTPVVTHPDVIPAYQQNHHSPVVDHLGNHKSSVFPSATDDEASRVTDNISRVAVSR